MSCEPDDFRPPAPGDRVTALVAAADARGDLPEKPRCHDYENCCHCHVCKTREDRDSGRKARTAKRKAVAA